MILDYMKLDPYFRRDNHHKMTFAMSYNESEKYILVLSHDEGCTSEMLHD